jgi:[acyl-carrier-protein] S-malonyltransferase
MSYAVLFAGQGSQYIGMGKDFYDKYDYVKDLYKSASLVLGYDLEDLCFKENELINQTKYTQPAVLVTSIAIFEVLKREYNLTIDATAGFSLGEYSALHASGVFDYQTIIHLIKYRALYMHEAALQTKGGMAAIIGMKREDLEKLCEEDSHVSIANYNCPNQLVVGGVYDHVVTLCEKAKQNGAKRAIMLNVSGGFHTSLMSEAASKMVDLIMHTKYHNPKFSIYMNCNALKLELPNLPQLMKKQIESPVYFEDTIRHMIESGVDTFIEVGPGSVLSGFVKKIDISKKSITIDKLSDLELLK